MTADLAVIAMAVVTLVNIGLDHRFRMKVADRLRVVSPTKAQQQEGKAAAQQPGQETVRRLPA